MSSTISGRLEASRSYHDSLAECRVEVFFDQKVLAESGAEPSSLIPGESRGKDVRSRQKTSQKVDSASANGAPILKGRASTRTDKARRFEVSLPDETELATKKLRFLVSAPSGQTIADELHVLDRIKAPVHISVSTAGMEPILLKAPAAPMEPSTRRITGQVIDRQGKPLPSNLQVLLFARKRGDKSTKALGVGSPVLVARADASGCFFGEAQDDEYESAAGFVEGIPDAIPISLENGRLPDRIPLVVELLSSADFRPTADD